jgi:CO dehydrogenase maturation factor
LKIAISGKGGVGKTTVSASLACALALRGYSVYAVDADPDASLGAVLGFSADELAKLRPVVEMDELIAERAGTGKGIFCLNPKVDDLVDKFSLQYGNIRLMQMGSVKQGGTSCYCRENSFLYAVLGNLLLDRKEVVIMDMSAGIEHLTRGTSRGVDLMIVVTEPTAVSVRTAGIVRKLASELGIGVVRVLANKVRTGKEHDYIRGHFREDELLAVLPFSEDILADAMDKEGGTAGDACRILPGMEEVAVRILAEMPPEIN